MKFKQFTKPAIKVNEDTVYACENFAFVVDGATGLLKDNITDRPSDAQWFAEKIRDYLIQHLGDTSKGLVEILKDTVSSVNREYMTLDGAVNVKSKPSANIALMRINKNMLEYFIIGDCTLTIKDENGNVTHLCIDDLPNLDNQNIEKMVNIAKEKNINVIEARPFINDALLVTRLSQNTDEGYYTLSNDPTACDHALVGELPLESVAFAYGVSDGFAQVFTLFDLCTKEELFDLLQKHSIEEIYAKLHNCQENDIFCNNYPRFKVRDDASIFYVEF